MKIVQERESGTRTMYLLEFNYVGENGWGFSFDCDEHGKVDEANLNPDALANLRACRTGMVGVRAMGPGVLKRFEQRWKTPRVGLCECGEEVALDRFTNTCSGCTPPKDYNRGGQLLAPRSSWGEETNESVADILAVDSMSAEEALDGYDD